LPDSARGGGPPTSACGGRGSPTSTCGGGGSSIRSRGGGSRSRGRATAVPYAVAAVPRPVAATPLPRRAVAEITRSGVVAAVPRSVAVAPRSRGRATAGPLCGQAAASPKPRRGSTSKAGEQATPVDVRVTTTTHEARCSSEWRHGRREMRAAIIARDILRSDAIFFSIIVFYAYHMYYLR
jgi:hypothetical protein